MDHAEAYARLCKASDAALSARKAAAQNLRIAEQNARNNTAAARDRITRAMVAQRVNKRGNI